MVCCAVTVDGVCVPPFTGEFEFTVGSRFSLVVDIMNLPAIGRPAASLARQNCQCTAFLKRKSVTIITITSGIKVKIFMISDYLPLMVIIHMGVPLRRKSKHLLAVF